MSGRQQKAERIRELMATQGEAVEENTREFNDGRYESTGDLSEYEALRDEARAIQEDAIERIPELVDQVTEAVEANGGTVYVADDAADANEYVRNIVADADADSVVKSKSMTSEELEVNEALAADGVDVWETDLGEFVLQVADEAPSHLVAPAIHKSTEDIAALFDGHFDPEEPLETAEDLTTFARDHLGEKIREADIGMTGANFVTADTGSIALVTSEGNARKCLAATDTHVAVAGVEKLLPRFEDLQPFVELIGRSGTGQDITSYVSLFTPPVDVPTLDHEADELGSADDREFHLILVDNGRMEMREDDQLRETLYCIRCSACANSCANFQHVGGHAFGGETYTGGIATGWEAGVHGQESAAEFNDLCTGCSRCVDACPVKIDIPWINTVVRDRINRDADQELSWLVEGLTPDEEPGGVDLQKRLFGNFETLAKFGSATAPVSNWLADWGPNRWLMARIVGIDRRRDLPEFQRETLVEWFAARDDRGPSDPGREVVLYPDLYTNHVQVERGKAAVRVLEALDVGVRVPAVRSSGRAPLSQGMIETATDHAEDVATQLGRHVDEGRDVVVVEPSDLAMFRREYERLVDEDAYDTLADDSYEILEYVYGLLEADPSRSDRFRNADGERLAYHSHCQQRTLGLEPYTTEVLGELGFDLVTSEVECCGMAGSFGYKAEYYELSMDVGATLRDQFEDEPRVVASGTSCMEQLDDLLDVPNRHPIEEVADRLE
ncbi:LUD domain-containing protein [Salinarchaeum laminariae]|uniref:LUD domain-containing protein n=1 Tax=Salinarchaeum laminariae TaxID=869888 RepID=UPI0020C170C6|nr:LUD domain-containing protein [Salinarchaeum laminariae]